MTGIRSRPHQAPNDAEPDETAALTTHFWRAYDKRMATIGFMAMLREFPSLVFQAVRLGYQASKIDMVGTAAEVAARVMMSAMDGSLRKR